MGWVRDGAGYIDLVADDGVNMGWVVENKDFRAQQEVTIGTGPWLGCAYGPEIRYIRGKTQDEAKAIVLAIARMGG